MKVKRLQNRIAESRFALPATALVALLACLSTGLIGQTRWIQFGLMVVSTYFMVELNNRNALLRTYSRMVSCSLLMLDLTVLHLFSTTITAGIVQLCFILHLLFLFRSYQDKRSMGTIFFAFAMLGIASLWFIQIVFFVPVVWFLMAARLYSMTWRSFLASIMGLLAPYWFMGGLLLYQGRTEFISTHIQSIATFDNLFPYNLPSTMTLVSLAYFALLGVMGSIHFLRNSYLDKIKTRMIYETIIILFGFILGFIILQPRHAPLLTPLLITIVAPLIAHYITFTRTFVTNLSFIAIIVTAFVLTALNSWQPLLTFL